MNEVPPATKHNNQDAYHTLTQPFGAFAKDRFCTFVTELRYRHQRRPKRRRIVQTRPEGFQLLSGSNPKGHILRHRHG
jgi:hypothetical protein